MHPIVRQILIASGMVLLFFAAIAIYTVIRHQGFDLYLFNKIVAGVTGVLLSIVLLTGPFSRLYDLFDGLLLYRKWLGMIAFILAYVHTLITLFFLPEKFPASRFTFDNQAFVFGLSCLLVLTVLFVYSFQQAIDSLNRKFWWKLQNWGLRIAFVLGVFHAVIVKFPYWQRWVLGGESSMMGTLLPPAGLIICCFMAYVVCIRVSEMFGKKTGLFLIPVLTVLLGLSWVGLVVLGVYAAVN